MYKPVLLWQRHSQNHGYQPLLRGGKIVCFYESSAYIFSAWKKAVLIDTDLRASGIQSDYRLRYSTQNHYGLSEYLSGICDMKDAIYRTNWPNTSIIPAGYEAPNPLQLLDTPAMEELIEQLAGQFDVVLIDTPPVGCWWMQLLWQNSVMVLC